MSVDAEGREVPAGESGELAVRGPNLLRGYWARPDLTERGFFRYPLPSGHDALFYRTGDLARLQPDGNYELVGRADRRVKLRGNRVELDEIETVLLSHPQVEQAAVYMIVEGEGYDRIEAAVIPQGGAQITPHELTAHVARQLPAYAVPSAITITEDLPKTSTGKINRRELQLRASQPRMAAQPQAPADQADLRALIQRFIAEELVGAADIRIDEDQELLGSGLIDSMGLLRLVSFIEEACRIQIPTHAMRLENFRSMRTIIDYVELRKAELGAN
jgi:acyl carrier protein